MSFNLVNPAEIRIYIYIYIIFGSTQIQCGLGTGFYPRPDPVQYGPDPQNMSPPHTLYYIMLTIPDGGEHKVCG